MNTAKTTPPILNGERREKVGHGSSGKCVFGRGQKGEVSWWGWGFLRFSFFFFSPYSPLLSSVCGACCLIETCPASCLPLTYIPGTGGWHLATSVAQHAQFPCRSSPKECSGAQREKVNLQACTARRRVAISLWGTKKKKNLLFFVVFLSLQHFVIFENTQEHQRYFYSLLLFFFFFLL